MTEPVNPYAPPAATLSGGMVPRNPIAFALAVLAQGPLLAGIVLVSVPVNLAIDLLQVEEGPGQISSAIWVFLVFAVVQSLRIGMVCEACRAFSTSEPASLGRLLSAAFPAWGRILVASLQAQLLVGLGLLAIVIPGLVAAVRYALVEVVVFRERLGPSAARERSAHLVTGRGWRAAAVLAGFLVASALPGTILDALRGSPLAWAPALDHVALSVAAATLSEVIYLGMFPALWMLFEEGVANERSKTG